MTGQAIADDRIRRAFAGEHVPDLPPAIQAIVTRLRHRLETEGALIAAGGFVAAGPEGWTLAWRAALDRIFDDALAAVRIALEDMNRDG